MAHAGMLPATDAGSRSPAESTPVIHMRKGGGPMKAVITLNDELRQSIELLLEDTQHEFEKSFRELSVSKSTKDKRRFVSYWLTLAELITRNQSQTPFDSFVKQIAKEIQETINTNNQNQDNNELQ